jgi:hypothetical protein
MACAWGLVVVAAGLGTTAAHAAIVDVYDNTSNATTFAWFNPPNDAGPTGIVADDITPLAGFAGQSVTQFQFGLFNNNTTPSVITPTAYFYENDGASAGPGTLIAAVPLAPVAMEGLSIMTVNEVNPLGYFDLPATTFWAGLSFSALSSDDSNAIGQLIYYPPTIGSSQDVIFISDNPASSASNPPGTLLSAPFAGDPQMSFYWQFSVTEVPEPTGAMAAAGLLVLTLSRRARRDSR